MTSDPRRHAPRLSFVGRIAPVLEVDGGRFEVMDLSSGGVRFRSTASAGGLTIGDVLRGVIRFPADHAVEVEGRVLRVAAGEAAMQLADGRERLASPSPAGPAKPRRPGLKW
jgi:hypothetical protein